MVQITTARKAVTLLLSYLIFTKPLTEQHATGLLLITMGIAMKMLSENKPPSASAPSRNGISSMKLDKGSTKGDGGQMFSDGKGGDEEETRPLV